MEIVSDIFKSEELEDWYANKFDGPAMGDIGVILNIHRFLQVRVDGKPHPYRSENYWPYRADELRLHVRSNDWDDCLELV